MGAVPLVETVSPHIRELVKRQVSLSFRFHL